MANLPSTWGPRAAAEAKASKLKRPFGQGGIGIELSGLEDGRRIGGVDLDTCRSEKTGAIQPWAQAVIDLFAGSYAEVSPSGTGIKVFFLYAAGDEDLLRRALGLNTQGDPLYNKPWKWSGKNHPPAIELHLGNRYFCVTDEIIAGSTPELIEAPTADIMKVIEWHGPQFVRTDPTANISAHSEPKLRPGERTMSPSTDRSRSAAAMGVGGAARRDGATYEQMCEAIAAHPTSADWYATKGQGNGARELRRIWDKTNPAKDKDAATEGCIRVIAGKLHNTATEGEAALLKSGFPLYQRGHSLVRPVTQDVPAAKGRMTVSASLLEVSAHSLVDALCACSEWERYDARAEGWVKINPPRQIADTILSRVGFWTFPKVIGVVTTPTIRPDGSILSAPGYDAATRLYHAADPAVTLHANVQRPTREVALAGLALLKGLLAEFPFVGGIDGVSAAVALSGIITPVVRGALSVAPMHIARATTAGSGKSYIVDVSSSISSGRPCPVIAAGGDEIETEKRLAALLLAGFPVISLDNINGELGGDLLCQAIERPLIRLRPLGRSEIVEIESRATIFGTGNGLRVRGDMTRRTLTCDLDAGIERPETREFKADPVAMVLADRGAYVSACLTIVRAYISAGKPGRLLPIASFSEWSDLVRSALFWLGCSDPADSMESAREDDPQLGELRELIEVWSASLTTDCPYSCKELVTESELRDAANQWGEGGKLKNPELREFLHRLGGVDRSGTVNMVRLGQKINGHAGRIAGVWRIRKEPSKGAVARYRLEQAPQSPQ